MRVLGLPLVSPDVVITRALSDLSAVARLARTAPQQLTRLLELGEEMVTIGHAVLELGDRIDRRAELILGLGERIDARAQAILALGERIDTSAESLLALGGRMHELGEQIDMRGSEIVDRATRVTETGSELVAVIPTLERAIAMTTPLEGAIDRVGRLVDRLPGGGTRRRPTDPASVTAPPDPSTDPPAPPDDPTLGRS